MTRRQRLLVVALLVSAAGVGAVVWLSLTRADSGGQLPPAAPTAESPLQVELLAREVLRSNPGDLSAQFRLARALRQQGRGPEAEAALARAIQLGLPEADGRREAALLMAGRDWPPQAEAILQRAVRDHPDDTELLLAVADSYAAKGRWANADPLYTQFLTRQPADQEVRFRRGVARMRAANFGPAADDFRAILAHDPGNFQARLDLAHSLLGDAQMGPAEQELRACRKEHPDRPEPLVGLAKCALERGDTAGAEGLLTQADALAPDSVLVLQDLAALHLRLQRYDAAVGILRRLVAIDPANKQAHLNLAQALLAGGKPDEARRHERIYEELDRQEADRLSPRRGMQ